MSWVNKSVMGVISIGPLILRESLGSNPTLRTCTCGYLLKIPRRAIISDGRQKTSDESDKGHDSRRNRGHHYDFHMGSGEVDGRPAAVRTRRNLHGPLDRLPRCAVVAQGILGIATIFRPTFRVVLWIWTGYSLNLWVRIPPYAPVIIVIGCGGFPGRSDGG